ncbi:flavin reductase family protein [Micromonospora purpureochromogenes]|uniref:flavin reductase family protein n=1 Tax=Micromonospora purpureochromogenes TaxID=47872 RepID=UPI0033C36484
MTSRTGTTAGRVDPGAFRHVLGLFCTGVTIITAAGDGVRPVGFTCQSFVSLSLDPPLVSFSVSRTSRSWPLIRARGAFGVNILTAEQEGLCRTFASRATDKFSGVDWRPGPVTGSPRLPGSLAWVECTVEAEYPGGDHVIAVGRVRDLEVVDGDADPLLFFLAGFRRPAPPLPPAPAVPGSVLAAGGTAPAVPGTP